MPRSRGAFVHSGDVFRRRYAAVLDGGGVNTYGIGGYANLAKG